MTKPLVTLCALEKAHLEQVRIWRNDPRIWRWARQNDFISEAAQLRWYDKIAADPNIKMYAIMASINPNAKGAVAFVGVCGLSSIDLASRHAEFSVYIDPKWHRNGFARAALEALFAHGFNNLGLHCIWGETFDGNPAASLFEAIGMKKEGTRRKFYFKDGRFIDAHLYSVLVDEWQRQAS